MEQRLFLDGESGWLYIYRPTVSDYLLRIDPADRDDTLTPSRILKLRHAGNLIEQGLWREI